MHEITMKKQAAQRRYNCYGMEIFDLRKTGRYESELVEQGISVAGIHEQENNRVQHKQNTDCRFRESRNRTKIEKWLFFAVRRAVAFWRRLAFAKAKPARLGRKADDIATNGPMYFLFVTHGQKTTRGHVRRQRTEA